LRSAAFDVLAAELALKHFATAFSTAFRGILPDDESFVIVQMIFQLGVRSESLLAVVLGALDDSWLSCVMALLVLRKVFVTVKAFATKLAIVRPNGVPLSPMHTQITLQLARKRTAWNIARM
jgi:hypothetical protein